MVERMAVKLGLKMVDHLGWSSAWKWVVKTVEKMVAQKVVLKAEKLEYYLVALLEKKKAGKWVGWKGDLMDVKMVVHLVWTRVQKLVEWLAVLKVWKSVAKLVELMVEKMVVKLEVKLVEKMEYLKEKKLVEQ